MATDNRMTAGKMYRSTANHRAIYVGDRTSLFAIDTKKEMVACGDPVVVLEVHQVSDSNVYDLYVLTKTGNLGWTRGMLWDDWEPMLSE